MSSTTNKIKDYIGHVLNDLWETDPDNSLEFFVRKTYSNGNTRIPLQMTEEILNQNSLERENETITLEHWELISNRNPYLCLSAPPDC